VITLYYTDSKHSHSAERGGIVDKIYSEKKKSLHIRLQLYISSGAR
jgi:hypothetical protein